MSYNPPNYTQIPNALLDEHMPTMKDAELRVVLAIARETFGWHRKSRKLSIPELQAKTGMSNRGVINGVQDALANGRIVRRTDGQGFAYSIAVEAVSEVHVSPDDTCTKLTGSRERSSREVVSEVHGLPPILKKGKKGKKSSRDDDAKTPSGNRDGRRVLLMIEEARCFLHSEPNQAQLALQIEERFTDAEIDTAFTKMLNEHRKKIGAGQRGITSPLAYLATVAADLPVAGAAGDTNAVTDLKFAEGTPW